MLAPFLLRLLKPGNEPRLRAWLVGLMQYLAIKIYSVYFKLSLIILNRILFFLH